MPVAEIFVGLLKKLHSAVKFGKEIKEKKIIGGWGWVITKVDWRAIFPIKCTKTTSVLWSSSKKKNWKKRRIDLLTFDWIDSLFFSQEAWQIDFRSSILSLQNTEALIHLRIFINV